MNRENFVGGENTKLGAYPFMALLGICEFNKNQWNSKVCHISNLLTKKNFGIV